MKILSSCFIHRYVSLFSLFVLCYVLNCISFSVCVIVLQGFLCICFCFSLWLCQCSGTFFIASFLLFLDLCLSNQTSLYSIWRLFCLIRRHVSLVLSLFVLLYFSLYLFLSVYVYLYSSLCLSVCQQVSIPSSESVCFFTFGTYVWPSSHGRSPVLKSNKISAF